MIIDGSIKDRIPVCSHSKRELIKPELINLLSVMEYFLERKMRFTSGIRCKICNKRVGGSPTSEHLIGHGVGIDARTSRERIEVARAALKAGCKRVGVYDHHVHIGTSPLHPQDVLWID